MQRHPTFTWFIFILDVVSHLLTSGTLRGQGLGRDLSHSYVNCNQSRMTWHENNGLLPPPHMRNDNMENQKHTFTKRSHYACHLSPAVSLSNRHNYMAFFSYFLAGRLTSTVGPAPPLILKFNYRVPRLCYFVSAVRTGIFFRLQRTLWLWSAEI